jgi:hypothetical protein
VNIMEASVYAEFLHTTVATFGLFGLLAVALAVVFLGYAADEEAKRMRIGWFEEPLAITGEPVPAQVIPLRKAA